MNTNNGNNTRQNIKNNRGNLQEERKHRKPKYFTSTENTLLAAQLNNFGDLTNPDEGMVFIAASGVEQIGMNLNIFGYQGKYIIVDVGISFSKLGSGVTLPAMNILYDLNPDNILAYVITHAHEDHIGGLCRFLKGINKPVYATKFTMDVIDKKIKENNVKDVAKMVVEAEKEFSVGPFDITFTYTAHSIPDSNHIIIKTPHASVFHTGDWKFDDAPMIGEKLNKNYLSSLAEKYNITALINDSTNSLEFNRVGTEGEAYEGLLAHILECKGKKVVVSCFSSNLARIKSLSEIAKLTNRKLILVGRSLLNMTTIGVQNGFLENGSHIIFDIKKADHIKPEESLYICTGSQGEINSVLQRCVLDLHPQLKIQKGDVVIFSSRIIPGNEDSITTMKNILIQKQVEIIDHNLKKNVLGVLHVSGHPGREDIKEMIMLTKCKWIVPVHGDFVHLHAVEKIVAELLHQHPNLKVRCKIPKGNGSVLRIHDKEGVELIGKFQTYTEVIDGNMYYPIMDDIFRQRDILKEQGFIIVIANKKKNHFVLNYGAVSKTEWESHLRNHIIKLINNSDFDQEQLRNQISYYIYQKYDKSPILVINVI